VSVIFILYKLFSLSVNNEGFLWDPPTVPKYYNFAWVPHTFGGVWPLLTLPYFAHWWGLILSVQSNQFVQFKLRLCSPTLESVQFKICMMAAGQTETT